MLREDNFEGNNSDLFEISILVFNGLDIAVGFDGFEFSIGLFLNAFDYHSDAIDFTLFCDKLKFVCLFEFVFDLMDRCFDVNQLGLLV